VHEVLLWLCGDLGGASINKSLLFLLALSILALFLFLKELDILTLGDERAKSLGINPSVCRRKLFLLCSFATALCVCFVGVIGFVGLIIPALLRRILGSVHSRLLPSCALSGATFLLLSDTFSRTAFSPFELPVGVVTGVCGGAFFLSLLSVKKDA
jgi:iron complex transport system permease protein